MLTLARTVFKQKMLTEAVPTDAAARRAAIGAIAENATLKKLRDDWGVLAINGDGKGTYSLNTRVVSKGLDRYQAKEDDRFDFDISHLKAILLFEWKAVYDLRHQLPVQAAANTPDAAVTQT